jgi:hypothetical protein
MLHNKVFIFPRTNRQVYAIVSIKQPTIIVKVKNKL